MTPVLQQLVTRCESIEYSRLSAGAVAATKRALLDALGCAIAAVGCEPATIAGQALPAEAGNVTVIGDAAPAALERAVLINGVLVRYLDMLDVYSARDTCHPAENVPLALACVESRGGSGKLLIETIVAGYEAQMRLAHVMSFHQMGMHHVTAAGIVAPIVIGRAWRLGSDVIVQAAALSGCRQFTLHALSKGRLSMAKAIGYAWSSMDGLFAMRLAQFGFTGPVEFLDWLGSDGPLKNAIAPATLGAPDEVMMIERVSFKSFPVQFELQTTSEIAIAAHQRLAGRDIEYVEVRVKTGTAKRTADPAKFRPENRETADHSLPICVAMALIDGKMNPAQFESGRWRDKDVLELANRIVVLPDESFTTQFPDGRPASIMVKVRGGETIKEFRELPLGDPRRPMDDAAIAQKFIANAAVSMDAAHAQEIVRLVSVLEEIEDVRKLTRLLAHGGEGGWKAPAGQMQLPTHILTSNSAGA